MQGLDNVWICFAKNQQNNALLYLRIHPKITDKFRFRIHGFVKVNAVRDSLYY